MELILSWNIGMRIIYFNNIIFCKKSEIVRKKRKINTSGIVYKFLKLPIILNC